MLSFIVLTFIQVLIILNNNFEKKINLKLSKLTFILWKQKEDNKV
jgi:hypothetical protein